MLFQKLLDIRKQRGAGFFLLLDPDKVDRRRLMTVAEQAALCGVDAILAGSSFVHRPDFDTRMAAIKNATSLPVLIFPGGSGQISRHADGVLFLSLISSRNPTYLIEEQVKGAPLVKEYGLEPIPTGYMLIESGSVSSVQFVSASQPLPRHKNDLAMAHALAAQYLGMKAVYLEAGSGGQHPVPEDMISAVSRYVDIPVIVGGGIRSPEEAAIRVQAGASFIVIGSHLEYETDINCIQEMADAIHSTTRTVI